MWVPRVDGSTSKMNKHLDEEHKMDEPANVNTASTVCSKREQGLDAYLVPQFTKEEQKHALALMVGAHSAGLLPPTLNDVPEFREYINFISKGRYTLPHRTKTTALEDEAFLEKRDLVIVVSSVKRATSISLTTDSATLPTGESFVAVTGDRVPSKNADSHTAENIASLLKDDLPDGYQAG
ncbi:hypothetical protein EMCRGX_G016155 [Ephydatia muelleri]